MNKPSGTILWTLFSGLVFTIGAAWGDEENEALYREGKKAFRACAACHSVTEPGLKEDEDWLKLNQVTACINAGEMTDRMRKALDVFFKSPKTRRPLLVDENYKPREGRTCGRIRVPATSGSAYLKADRESIREGGPPKVRLYWKASEKGKTLTVPAGRYRVITYRFYRHSKKNEDELWTLSVTDTNGCAALHITGDGEARFDLKPEMRCKLSARNIRGGVNISLAMRNETNSILTLSRDGEMCIPRYVVIDSGGKELFRQPFENT